MNSITKAASSGNSSFDSIRRYRADGSEYWSARELMTILNISEICKYSHQYVRTHLTTLTRQECGLLILEACSIHASNFYVGSWLDSLFLWNSAMAIYEGQSASGIFNAVRCQIQEATHWENQEDFLYPIIRKHSNKIFGESRIVDRKTNGKDIPDFFVSIGAEVIPVEVKKGIFDRNALLQLERYVEKYQPSGLGIAVANELDRSLRLPRGIRFVALSRERIYQLEGRPSLRSIIESKVIEIQRARLVQQTR